MISRYITEDMEEKLLSPFAVRSKESRGRLRSEPQCSLRTAFQRDRDRIIHSKGFRRLKQKTQVFIIPEGDHYRTRLTHTLEVSQIARTIARALRLNEDLTEAIALGHDLGHTPFGHAGEEALDEIHPGGFKHNKQSLRVVDYLEGDRGLNLTWEVRDGILNHTGPGIPSTLEGQVVRLADRIAYINHDIDDAIRGGLLNIEQLPQECLQILGRKHSERINTMVCDVVQTSIGKDSVVMSDEIKLAMKQLRQYMFDHVYIGSEAKREEAKAKQVVQYLYNYFCRHPMHLPREFKQYDDETKQNVVDYIAGMTDRYAIRVYQKIFLPSPWVDKEEMFNLF
ncbi:deoxyguanosinetriphosphate triphosphohydrolase [Desulfofalx alkaliphila]|uniref:deoxyguanosinetriphosphate triphosphohydrolase n=1 Tax=Desulfofalx alkaliphila TaxID=105483 RepID=UPI000A695C39|nr:deoxyguanosinetriphosphate triphosphohydrolase [Desulfofalx alkaliphila]